MPCGQGARAQLSSQRAPAESSVLPPPSAEGRGLAAGRGLAPEPCPLLSWCAVQAAGLARNRLLVWGPALGGSLSLRVSFCWRAGGKEQGWWGGGREASPSRACELSAPWPVQAGQAAWRGLGCGLPAVPGVAAVGARVPGGGLTGTAPPPAETIIAFAWEPNGSKFAVLHGEAPRISVSFYHVKSNGKIELISGWPHLSCVTWGAGGHVGGRPGQPREGGAIVAYVVHVGTTHPQRGGPRAPPRQCLPLSFLLWGCSCRLGGTPSPGPAWEGPARPLGRQGSSSVFSVLSTQWVLGEPCGAERTVACGFTARFRAPQHRSACPRVGAAVLRRLWAVWLSLPRPQQHDRHGTSCAVAPLDTPQAGAGGQGVCPRCEGSRAGTSCTLCRALREAVGAAARSSAHLSWVWACTPPACQAALGSWAPPTLVRAPPPPRAPPGPCRQWAGMDGFGEGA